MLPKNFTPRAKKNIHIHHHHMCARELASCVTQKPVHSRNLKKPRFFHACAFRALFQTLVHVCTQRTFFFCRENSNIFSSADLSSPPCSFFFFFSVRFFHFAFCPNLSRHPSWAVAVVPDSNRGWVGEETATTMHHRCFFQLNTTIIHQHSRSRPLFFFSFFFFVSGVKGRERVRETFAYHPTCQCNHHHCCCHHHHHHLPSNSKCRFSLHTSMRDQHTTQHTREQKNWERRQKSSHE